MVDGVAYKGVDYQNPALIYGAIDRDKAIGGTETPSAVAYRGSSPLKQSSVRQEGRRFAMDIFEEQGLKGEFAGFVNSPKGQKDVGFIAKTMAQGPFPPGDMGVGGSSSSNIG